MSEQKTRRGFGRPLVNERNMKVRYRSIRFDGIRCRKQGVIYSRLHRRQQRYALNRHLIYTLAHNDTETALALVNAGADPNTRVKPTPTPSLKRLLDLDYLPPSTDDNPTAFIIACGRRWIPPHEWDIPVFSMAENLILPQAMLAHGADIDARTFGNRTALFYAIAMQRLPTVKWLVENGADVNAQDDMGYTPLFTAINHPTATIARLLLSHGANPNAQLVNGMAALHQVAEWPDASSLISELLVYGADPDLPDKEGHTPLMIAEEEHDSHIIALLRKYSKHP